MYSLGGNSIADIGGTGPQQKRSYNVVLGNVVVCTCIIWIVRASSASSTADIEHAAMLTHNEHV